MTILERVKTALRISGSAYDDELTDLIEASVIDLGIANVPDADVSDPIVRTAVVTYCRMHFGSPSDYDRLKQSYDEQKSQLGMSYMYGGNAL